MLNTSRAYVMHTKGPEKVSKDSLERLAKPKVEGAHPDIAIGINDPLTYAQWKTEQLAIKRLTQEREQREIELEKKATQDSLLLFRHAKRQEEQLQAQKAAAERAAEAKYARELARFLHDKASQDVAEYRLRQQDLKERAATLAGQRVLGGPGFARPGATE